MEKLTIDIRDKHVMNEKEFGELLKSHEENGYEVTQVYCTDEQREKIESFEETDKKTKKVSKKYGNLTLTVE